MVDRRYLFVLALLLLLPLASAYTVEKVSLEWQGKDVKTIAPNVPLDGARIVVRLSPDVKDCFSKYAGKCYVVVDASSLAQDPALKTNLAKLTFRVQDCSNTTGVYICTSTPFQVRTANATNKISYYIQVDKAYPTQSSNIQLALDTTSPKTISLTTGYCREDTCYVASNTPTPFTVTFEDTQTSFDYRLVFVDANPYNVVRVSSCQGKKCTGNITVPCSADGQPAILRITSMGGVTSREDAQNTVGPFQQKVICSTKAPQVLDWKLTSDGIGGQAVSGGAITAVAKVKVFVGSATGVVDTQLINNVNKTTAVCVQDDVDESIFVCTWQIAKLNPGKFDLSFIVADSIGNSYLAPNNKPVRVNVLNLTKPTKPLNYFTVQPGKPDPEKINRMAIDLARTNYMPYPVYLPYTITRLNPKAQIVRQDLKSCWYKLPNETNYTSQYNLFSFGGKLPESHVLYPTANYDVANRLNLQIRADRKVLQLSDDFDVKCQLDFSVTEGDIIYSTPISTNITFSIGLRESPLGQPGQEFVNKIDTVSKQLNNGDSRRIMQLEKLRQQFDQVCKGAETVAYIQSVSGSLEGLGHTYCASGVAASAGKALHAIGKQINDHTEGFMKVAWEGHIPTGGIPARIQNAQKFAFLLSSNNALLPVAGPLQMACRQINCRSVPDTQNQFSATGSATKDIYGFAKSQIASNLNVADPENGIVGSVSMMCVGGVIYNMNKNLAIDCEYLMCLKQQSTTGANVAVCDNARGFNKCMRVIGEYGEAPYVRVMKNLFGNVNHVLKNLPVIGARFAFMEACAEYTGAMKKVKDLNCGDMKAFSCILVDSILTVADTGKQSTQAFSGLRNEAAAKKALEVCSQAIADKPPSKIAQKGISSAVSSFGGIARNAAAQRDAQLSAGSTTVTPNVVQQLSEQYYSRNGHRPEAGAEKVCFGATGCTTSVPIEVTSTRLLGQTYTTVTVTDGKSDKDPSYSITVKDTPEDVNAQLGATSETKLVDVSDHETSPTGPDGTTVEEVTTTSYDKAIQQAYADGIALPTDPTQRAAFAKQYVAGRDHKKALDDLTGSKDAAGKPNVKAGAARESVKQVIEYNGCDSDVCRKAISEKLAKNGITCQGTECTANIGRDGKACSTTGPDCVAVSKEDQVYDTSQANKAYAALANIAGSYIGKWLQDQGLFEKMQLGGAIGDFAEKLDPERVKLSICQDSNNIQDNDEGAIYSFTQNEITSVTAIFGAERRLLENESGKSFNYVALVYVTNPQDSPYEFMMNITLEDMSECVGTCSEQFSLTNNAAFNLSAGAVFGNGNAPKTRIIYLPAEYKKMCITFDKPFPNPTASTSKAKYCRSISETTFNTGSPPPTTTSTTTTTTNSATGSNPLGGWT
jgi:hypothetical protein